MKRSFILLEIIIGLAILTIAMHFMFLKPILFIKNEKSRLDKIEMAKLFQATLNEIKLKLYTKELEIHLPLEKTTFTLPAKTLQIAGFKPKEISTLFTLESLDTNNNEPAEKTSDLLKVRISFNKKKFEKQKALIFVKKL